MKSKLILASVAVGVSVLAAVFWKGWWVKA